MKKNAFGILCAIVMVSPAAVFAVDQAGAVADLADIAAISVQSKANLASVALGGDVDAVSEAGKRADAVDASMARAQEAFAAMERALAGGDEDAAQSAANEIKASKQKAADALDGVIPDEMVSLVQAWKEAQSNTGGGPGRAYDPPNIYDVPWQTIGMRNFYISQFGSFWSSGRGTGDTDATPE